MNNICPVSCGIVKDAISAFEERGVSMGQYVDYMKEQNMRCQMCVRNEKSNVPAHMRKDNGGNNE